MAYCEIKALKRSHNFFSLSSKVGLTESLSRAILRPVGLLYVKTAMPFFSRDYNFFSKGLEQFQKYHPAILLLEGALYWW